MKTRTDEIAEIWNGLSDREKLEELRRPSGTRYRPTASRKARSAAA